jgi:ABC-type phosphate/phosphonate transport system substrate-binding protein
MADANIDGVAGHQWLVNARMYAVTDAARAAWQRIFARLAERTGIALAPIEHKPPALLSELWRRGDLGCVFMCGWPIARAEPKPRLLAVPVPRPDRYRDRPIYFTDIVVARDSPARTIEDTFGGTVGWTLEDSNSGFNTLRHYLLGFRTPERPRLYSRSIGPLLNPLGALRAVAEGRVDVVPVDSFCHDLFKASGHPVISLTRTIATTPPSPMPALVASPEIPGPVADALRNALLQAHHDPILDPELESALVRHFVEPDVGSYDYTERLAQAALAARYPIPA